MAAKRIHSLKLSEAFDKLDTLARLAQDGADPSVVDVDRILICAGFERADVVSLVRWWERARAVVAARVG